MKAAGRSDAPSTGSAPNAPNVSSDDGQRGAPSGASGRAPIDVAVGVVLRDDGAFLLADRPAGKPMAGHWEFPGGKLESGETVFDALRREFAEELGLTIVDASPWVERVVVYPHATVRLHFWRSIGEGRGWHGTPVALEGQRVRWERVGWLTTSPWLVGAEPAKRWLQLPERYAISNASVVGVDAFLPALDAAIAAGDLAQLQLREPGLAPQAFAALFDAVLERCRRAGVRLVVNSAHPASFATRADGLHLTAHDLVAAERRPDVDWCFASCHDEREAAHAGALGVDGVVVGPVRATASHPGRPGIGWPAFAAIARSAGVPAWAIGGLGRDDVSTARRHGAHGIATIRNAWFAVDEASSVVRIDPTILDHAPKE